VKHAHTERVLEGSSCWLGDQQSHKAQLVNRTWSHQVVVGLTAATSAGSRRNVLRARGHRGICMVVVNLEWARRSATTAASGGRHAVNAGAGCFPPGSPIDLWRVENRSLADQGALPFTIGTAAGDVGVPVACRAWLRQATSSMCVKWLDVTAGAGGSHQPMTANLASPLSAFAVCHLPSRLTG